MTQTSKKRQHRQKSFLSAVQPVVLLDEIAFQTVFRPTVVRTFGRLKPTFGPRMPKSCTSVAGLQCFVGPIELATIVEKLVFLCAIVIMLAKYS